MTKQIPDLTIRNGQIVTPDGVIIADMAVKNGLITEIAPDLTPAAQDIAASGQWVMPGGVYPHAHT